MYEMFSDNARRALQLANREAQRLKHEYIGTEHLLLGLLNQENCGGARVLRAFHLDLKAVQRLVEQAINSGPDPLTIGHMPWTPHAKKVIEYAIDEARNLHHERVGSEHVLLGLFREEDSVAGVVLRSLGLKLDQLRERVRGYTSTPAVRRRDPEPPGPLPDEVQAEVDELDHQIEQLNREKESAVAASDFEKAASLRDRSDRLRKKRQDLIRQAQEGAH